MSVSQSVLFSPGDSTTSVDVGIISDFVLEFLERFQLVLSSTNDTRVSLEPGMISTTIEIIDTSG